MSQGPAQQLLRAVQDRVATDQRRIRLAALHHRRLHEGVGHDRGGVGAAGGQPGGLAGRAELRRDGRSGQRRQRPHGVDPEELQALLIVGREGQPGRGFVGQEGGARAGGHALRVARRGAARGDAGRETLPGDAQANGQVGRRGLEDRPLHVAGAGVEQVQAAQVGEDGAGLGLLHDGADAGHRVAQRHRGVAVAGGMGRQDGDRGAERGGLAQGLAGAHVAPGGGGGQFRDAQPRVVAEDDGLVVQLRPAGQLAGERQRGDDEAGDRHGSSCAGPAGPPGGRAYYRTSVLFGKAVWSTSRL